MRTSRSRDLYAGLLFAAFGTLALVVARGYPTGTAARMGPGYFPTVVGGALVLLGAAIAGRAIAGAGGQAVGRWRARPPLLVAGSVVAFALLLRPLGLVPAALVLVGLSSLAGRRPRLLEVFAVSLALAALAVGIFVYGLGLPFRVLPL